MTGDGTFASDADSINRRALGMGVTGFFAGGGRGVAGVRDLRTRRPGRKRAAPPIDVQQAFTDAASG